ncbi:hypothetical protein A2U01_0080771, partial [Trifolium medium]|nr:hypothetical protein [Trifolium medium]
WERLWRGNSPRKYREFEPKLCDGGILPVSNFAGFTRAYERLCIEEINSAESMNLSGRMLLLLPILLSLCRGPSPRIKLCDGDILPVF